MGQRMRLDVYLESTGMAPSRAKAQALILAGAVSVNGRVPDKAGMTVGPDDRVEVKERLPFVSRGGIKLAHALKVFDLNPRGWQVVDIGASTGGFTDCWLQHGAAQVFAVDVGYGQLDWTLRTDPRVHVFERTNARYLTLEGLYRKEPFDAASIDVSFIGIRLILDPLRALLHDGATVVALIKPQFEAGPRNVSKGGVVRDPAIHEDVLRRFVHDVTTWGYRMMGLEPSPIRGPEGNIEFLAYLRAEAGESTTPDILAVVTRAWEKKKESNH